MKQLIFVITLFLCLSCSHITLDPSQPAMAAGDFTLVSSVCDSHLSQGVGICRVVQDSPTSQNWEIVLPWTSKVSGEAKIRYKGQAITKAVTSNLLSIPWSEIVGGATWDRSMDGPVQIVVTLKATTDTGDQIVQGLGYAMIIVLAKGYSPLAIDSGFEGWKTNCEVQYSTAGRSALKCE